jgi:hypothetical protein
MSRSVASLACSSTSASLSASRAATRARRAASSSSADSGRPPPRPAKWRTETVYAITDLHPHQARPDELATWLRGHRHMENKLHWVRDVTFAEDHSQVRTGSAPQVMVTFHNLAISLHRLAGAISIAAALRHHARNAARPLQLGMIP